MKNSIHYWNSDGLKIPVYEIQYDVNFRDFDLKTVDL